MPFKRCAAEAATWLLQVSILLVVVAEAHAQGTAASDREVLEAFYHATGGPGWSDRANWLSAAPLAEWYGVVTDENGRVTSLDLGGNALSGEIPPALGRLAHLEHLNLGFQWDPMSQREVYNELSGAIPPELAALANLQWLYLGGNQLSGTIPPELAALANLQRLDLWRNELSGAIPPELGGLTNLHWLYLRSNQLSGRIPPELGRLTNLRILELADTLLTGKIPQNLMQLSELAKFDISRTGVCVPTGTDFQAWLATIANFRSSGLACDGSLRVTFSESSHVVREGSSVEVTVRLIDQTEGPAKSATIALTATPGGGATANDYSGMPEHITITAPATEAAFVFTAVEDPHYDHGETVTLGLRRPLPSGVTAGNPDSATVTIIDPGTVLMTDREVLEALYEGTGGPEWRDRANWLSEAPLSEWHGVVTDGSGRVTSLDLGGNGLSGQIPPALGRLAYLERLHLDGDRWDPMSQQWVTNELSGEIPPELAELTNLRSLRLDGNQLTGSIPPVLGEMANLQQLDLSSNQLSGEIPPEMSALTNLQRLLLSRNQLTGSIPPELGGLTNLRELRLWGNQLGGEVPPELAELTNLEYLDLGFNQDLTGTIPMRLQHLPLSTLNLMATAVCVPEDAEQQAWLATIEFASSGLTCGRPPDATPSIDVAVFYTSAARGLAGGTAEIEAKIDLMVAETNQAYEDSGVNQRIVLVAREEVQYEDRDTFLALDRLADPSDGYMDEVHAIRDQAGADLVHLIAGDGGGIADLAGAFSVICETCTSRVFAHELGHNMGLQHGRYQAAGFGSFPFSYGYVNQRAFEDGAPESSRWHTIMSYGSQCVYEEGFACGSLMRFSNPNQTYLGDPLGVPGDNRTSDVAGPADAARAINLARHSVAAFRPRSQDTISRAPSGGKRASRQRPVAGVWSGGLFTAVSPPKHGASASDPKTLRRREVAVDIGMLAQVTAGEPTALPLNLFDDVMLTGIIVKRTPTYSGGYALTGPLFGVAGGTAALVVNGDVVAGTVRIPGATYRIRPAGAGRHAIAEDDPSQSSWRCGTEPGPRIEKNR